MEKLIRKVDIVYHLAASVGVKYVIDNPLKSLETNIKGTEIVLDVANRKGKKKVICHDEDYHNSWESDCKNWEKLITNK